MAEGIEADDLSFNVYVSIVRAKFPELGLEDAEALLMNGVVKPEVGAGRCSVSAYHVRVTNWTAMRAALAVCRLRAA